MRHMLQTVSIFAVLLKCTENVKNDNETQAEVLHSCNDPNESLVNPVNSEAV